MARKRCHIVLVPGFAGFDALGQLEYYAGVTPLFRDWKGTLPAGREVELHYFDNLPTAAVVTRAARLRRYLAKLIARGEIAPARDELTLIGHSTGGLDIRQLVLTLDDADPELVDGGVEVSPAGIRRCLRRVVFLSVPHWGTNIADWVRDHSVSRDAFIAEVRAAVAGAQMPLIDQIETLLLASTARLTGADLPSAARDALREGAVPANSAPLRRAGALEAAAQLELYLNLIASDFHAINDLTSRPPRRGPTSPAHFDSIERRNELTHWRSPKIETLSYVTQGNRPYRFPPGAAAPPLDLAKPATYPEFAKDPMLSAGTDIFYRACYRACAGGPFSWPASGTRLPGVELWDNDGIVNTASMNWPIGEKRLVYADHMDIVGHYHLVPAPPGTGRSWSAYDLLKSTPPFNAGKFKDVWTGIFDFCAGP